MDEMNIQDIWEKALRNTTIVRPRVQPLLALDTTSLPYIFLAESQVNLGDTTVRKGNVFVEKPSLILPNSFVQFEGFDFEKNFHIDKDMLINFLLVRGARFPSLKYNNKTCCLEVYERNIKEAIRYFSDKLQKEEDVHTGLITGPDDCWQFSVLIFICSQVLRSADNDIKKLLDDFKRKGGLV